MVNTRPICLRLDSQATDFACFLTRCSAGINIAINNAMIPITTRSSINVKPVRILPLSRSGMIISNGVETFVPVATFVSCRKDLKGVGTKIWLSYHKAGELQPRRKLFSISFLGVEFLCSGGFLSAL